MTKSKNREWNQEEIDTARARAAMAEMVDVNTFLSALDEVERLRGDLKKEHDWATQFDIPTTEKTKKSELLSLIGNLQEGMINLEKRVAELENSHQPPKTESAPGCYTPEFLRCACVLHPVEITVKNETEKPVPLNITVHGWPVISDEALINVGKACDDAAKKIFENLRRAGL